MAFRRKGGRVYRRKGSRFTGRFKGKRYGLSRAPIRRSGFKGFGSYTKGRVGAELKTIDINKQTVALSDSTPHTMVLNDIPNGTDIVNRIGRKVTIKSTHVWGYIYPETNIAYGTATSIAQGGRIRMLIVWDKTPNGTDKDSTDSHLATVLKNNDAGATIPVNNELVLAHYNLANRDRYVILKDKIFTLQPALWTAPVLDPVTLGKLAAGSGNTVFPFSLSKKMNATTIYNAANPVAASTGINIQTGRLMFFAVTDELGTLMKMDYTTRTRFLDC